MELINDSLRGFVQVNTGVTEYTGSSLPDTVRLTRLEVGKAEAVVLMEKAPSAQSGLKLAYRDYGARSQQEYTYRVEYIANGVATQTLQGTIKSEFNGILLTDGKQTYVTLGGASYSPQRNFTSTVVQPYYSQFPHMVINGSQNYDSGTVEGYFNELRPDCRLDDFNAYDAQALLTFLTNRKAKVLKTYDGLCMAVFITSDSPISYAKGDIATLKQVRFAYKQIGGDAKVREMLYG